MPFSRLRANRILFASTLLLAVAGTAPTGHVAAAAKSKSYTSSQYKFTLSYPTTWTLDAAAKTASMLGPAEAKVNPTCLFVTTRDENASFTVLVSRHNTTLAQIKANETTFLKETENLIGGNTYSTSTSAGKHLVMAYATNKVDAKHNAQWVLVAGSDGKFTYCAGAAYVDGYPATKQNIADLKAIMSSFHSV